MGDESGEGGRDLGPKEQRERGAVQEESEVWEE
jgi:hypothetical protein